MPWLIIWWDDYVYWPHVTWWFVIYFFNLFFLLLMSREGNQSTVVGAWLGFNDADCRCFAPEWCPVSFHKDVAIFFAVCCWSQCHVNPSSVQPCLKLEFYQFMLLSVTVRIRLRVTLTAVSFSWKCSGFGWLIWSSAWMLIT